MSMWSCEKCWDTICCCGWSYRDWTADDIKKQIAMLQKVLSTKTTDDATQAPPVDEI